MSWPTALCRQCVLIVAGRETSALSDGLFRGVSGQSGAHETISYGEELTACREASEACYQRNRRDRLLKFVRGQPLEKIVPSAGGNNPTSDFLVAAKPIRSTLTLKNPFLSA